ncbi:allophanate hydrolase [Marmoricola sp. RAF53]|uniref:allophanate hydrolase n=1 Tax=Marmoricola sp. RAF53 TaxID=3233059 RepID=UPI003F9522DA
MSAAEQPVWISRLDDDQQARYAGRGGPLDGLRFAVKDNIDLAGLPTTAADPRRTTPADTSAEAVQRLVDAGAVPVGKTNLDQYATGLVGTRSPYGACHAVDSPEHVSGGSSSGSAVAVAAGLVDFALGTDTAGSGRVPAAFNGIVGIKPTRGLVSTRGVVPACRSLDCVTVFARDVATARAAYEVMAGFDAEDPYARRVTPAPLPTGVPVIGVPDAPLGLDPLHEDAWRRARADAERIGTVVEVDVSALLAAAELLYGGPWLAERLLAFGDALDDDQAVDPVVRSIVLGGRGISAVEAFAGFERLTALAREAEAVWTGIDALLLPVTPTHPTLAEVAAEPIAVNTRLGRFTNMANLLDLCAVAFPGPRRGDGLPFGVQLLAPAGHDDTVAALAATWCGETLRPSAGDPTETVLVAVAGAHLTGQPLNADLVGRGATLVRTARMAPGYRMYLVDGPLPRPGLTRLPGGGAVRGPGPEVEVWRLPAPELAGFAATVAPPLAIGPVDLADGERLLGFVCTGDGVDPDRDITGYGGWRAYLSR